MFLNRNLEERVYMKIPNGLWEILADFFKKHLKENTIGFKTNHEQVLEVRKALYGLK